MKAVSFLLLVFLTIFAIAASNKGELIPFKALWSSASDIAPALAPDGNFLVFQSNRKDSDRFSLYTSFYKLDKTLSTPKQIVLDKRATFEGQPYFTGRDGTIVYTAIGPGNFLTEGERIEADLWLTTWKKGKWAKPKHFGSPVNTKALEITPCINRFGNDLYFASNRPGGYGGIDIWVSRKRKGKWSQPKNLGPQINTKADEIFPRIHADNKTLYFSSNREGGQGGFDIHISRRKKGGPWSSAKNVGDFVNTETNDHLNGIPADASYILISRGEIDEEKIFKIKPTPDFMMPTPLASVRLIVLDKETKVPLEVDVRIENAATKEVVLKQKYQPQNKTPLAIGDDGKATGSNENYFEQIGLFTFLETPNNFNVFLDSPDYLFLDQSFQLEDKRAVNYNRIFYMLPLRVGSKLPLHNVYFVSKKAKLLPSSKKYLKPIADFLKRYPHISVRIDGHTAKGKGSKRRNKKLSRKRAKAVAKYLIKQGIKKKRVSTRGYGESRPVAPNDTSENMAKNRRVEFVVVSIKK